MESIQGHILRSTSSNLSLFRLCSKNWTGPPAFSQFEAKISSNVCFSKFRSVMPAVRRPGWTVFNPKCSWLPSSLLTMSSSLRTSFLTSSTFMAGNKIANRTWRLWLAKTGPFMEWWDDVLLVNKSSFNSVLYCMIYFIWSNSIIAGRSTMIDQRSKWCILQMRSHNF